MAAVFIAAVAAQGGYKAPEYAAPSYAAPAAYGGDYKPANGRVKIQVTWLLTLILPPAFRDVTSGRLLQVYRGPNKEYGKGYDKGYDGAFAPWGFYVTQPEDNKGYGY